VCNCGRKG